MKCSKNVVGSIAIQDGFKQHCFNNFEHLADIPESAI